MTYKSRATGPREVLDDDYVVKIRVQRFRSGPVFGTILGPNLNSVSVSVSVNLGRSSVRS